MNIRQVIATVVDAWKASHGGKLPARLQVGKDHSTELGLVPTYIAGDISIPIDYVDMKSSAVRCLGQEMSKAFVEANSLPSWTRPPVDQS
jgi:hypothetical protein